MLYGGLEPHHGAADEHHLLSRQPQGRDQPYDHDALRATPRFTNYPLAYK